MGVTDFFDRGWRRNPTGTAYVMGDRSWSFDQAGAFSCQVGHALVSSTLEHGAKVAILSPNDPEAWLCVIGTWRAGMVWVPLNPASPVAENEKLMEQFDCEALIYADSLELVAKELVSSLPMLRLLVSIGGNTSGHPELHEWVEKQPVAPLRTRFAMDDVVAITPTGGTTGIPKGVMNTHRSFSSAFVHMMLAFHYDGDEEIRNLAAAPMTHTTGILSMPATARGGTVYVIERADSELVASAIEKYQITDLFLPPTVIYRMLDNLHEHQYDFSSLRYFIYGAAPMSVEKLRRATQVFGGVMTAAYGQMESPGSISFLRPEERRGSELVSADERHGSCGQPMPLIALEIRDEQDRPLGVREAGEICVRGDLVMKGYYNEPDKTAETVLDGWLHTGDIGYLDEEGYLYITDRKKDMIITGGFNVFPSEVEQVLWAHPSVNDCAVVGIPHPDWGESVTAVVELNPHAVAPTEAELIDWCRERLGGIRSPKMIEFRDGLPRSVNGKVWKKVIREQFWADAERRI